MERRILRAAAIAIGAAALIGLTGTSASATGLGGAEGTVNAVRVLADGTITAVSNLAACAEGPPDSSFVRCPDYRPSLLARPGFIGR